MELGRCNRLVFIVFVISAVVSVFYYNQSSGDLLNSIKIRFLWDKDIDANRSTTDTATVHVSYRNLSWAHELIGSILPRPEGETNDRMKEQVDYMDVYKSLKNESTLKTKVILGVGYFNLENFKIGQDFFLEGNCPINQCITTRDMSLAGSADAILISEYGWATKLKLPKPPHQVWIAQHWESPKHNRIDVHRVKNLINWTASYRRESTVAVGYGHFVKIPNTTAVTGVNYAGGKTMKVAMVVSNCNPANDRMGFAQTLGKYIPVDIYGKCGRKCPTDNSNMSCTKWVGTQYKFYLAFENSNCKDYITEKFTSNGLRNNILPIVYGASRADYAAMAPPYSYIHVDDFTSPQMLAAYLHHLDRNDTLYNEYFAWKGMYTGLDQRYWCRLCMLLHLREDIDYVHWYKDYRKWWNDVCPSSASCSFSLLLHLMRNLMICCVLHFFLFVKC